VGPKAGHAEDWENPRCKTGPILAHALVDREQRNHLDVLIADGLVGGVGVNKATQLLKSIQP
jgi:hypothetical protein